tara:strand:- start:494 stop:688 length:195 start_codon:yes stop_codon:yes gene_type:complete
MNWYLINFHDGTRRTASSIKMNPVYKSSYGPRFQDDDVLEYNHAGLRICVPMQDVESIQTKGGE